MDTSCSHVDASAIHQSQDASLLYQTPTTVEIPMRRRSPTLDLERGATPSFYEDDETDVVDDSDNLSCCGSLSEHANMDDSLLLLEGDDEDGECPSRHSRPSCSKQSFQCRQALLKSRCVRGFFALSVYVFILLERSKTTSSSWQYYSLVEDFATENATAEALGDASFLGRDLVSTTSTSEAESTELLTKVPLAKLPHFHHPHSPTLSVNSNHAATHMPYHSKKVPPTSDLDSKIHWHKIPPDIKRKTYHKKHRPVLSYATSYELSQEPLVFGRESKVFFSDEREYDTTGGRGSRSQQQREAASRSWSTTFVWLSLLALAVDTSYREWQHYQFRLRYAVMASPVSDEERRLRRSSHHRRSPSPAVVRQRRRV